MIPVPIKIPLGDSIKSEPDAPPDDDVVYFIELLHAGYKNPYPYGPAKTA
jgi:hypothetical protein